MNAAAQTTAEPVIALPTRLLASVVVAGALLSIAGCLAVSMITQATSDDRLAGVLGAGVTGLIALGSVLLMAPWRPRAVGWWMTTWLGATVARLMVTPIAAWLLYSAVSLPADPLIWSIAVTYLVVLFTEVAVLSIHLHGVFDARGRSSRNKDVHA